MSNKTNSIIRYNYLLNPLAKALEILTYLNQQMPKSLRQDKSKFSDLIIDDEDNEIEQSLFDSRAFAVVLDDSRQTHDYNMALIMQTQPSIYEESFSSDDLNVGPLSTNFEPGVYIIHINYISPVDVTPLNSLEKWPTMGIGGRPASFEPLGALAQQDPRLARLFNGLDLPRLVLSGYSKNNLYCPCIYFGTVNNDLRHNTYAGKKDGLIYSEPKIWKSHKLPNFPKPPCVKPEFDPDK
jgi:hypothetical protein